MLRDGDGRRTEEDRIDERPRVRITGDPPFPLELGRLICDCGCNVSLPIDPDLVVVKISYRHVEKIEEEVVEVVEEEEAVEEGEVSEEGPSGEETEQT